MATFPQLQQFQSPGGMTRNTNQNNNDEDDDDDELVDALERILSAERNRRITASSLAACKQSASSNNQPASSIGGANSGPLMENELEILSLLCTKNSKRATQQAAAAGASTNGSNRQKTTHGFGAVDGDSLTTLAELLEKHVNLAVGVDLVQEAAAVIQRREINIDQWLRKGAAGKERVAALRLGLEAASILLFILTSPGVELSIVSEDAIDASFTLLRHHLTKNVIPALSNTGHLLASLAKDDERGITSPRKRKRKSVGGSGDNSATARELQKVYKPIISTIQNQLTLMERIEVAVSKLFLDDQQIVTLASGALAALEIEASMSLLNNTNKLQLATISLVTSVFRKFPMHRSGIIEDLFPLMLKLPTSKKSMRTCPVQYSSCPAPWGTRDLTTNLFSSMLANGPQPHQIQMITALVLSIIQCCVVRPAFSSSSSQQEAKNGELTGQVNNANNNQCSELESGLRGCQSVADVLVTQLLQRCCRKGEDGGASEFRPILTNLVEDLLLVFMIPEYPAAQMVLLSCTHGLSRDIIIASQASNSSASETVVESTHVNTAFDILGRICAAYAKVFATQRDKEFRTELDTTASSDTANCYCKGSDREGLKLSCDDCRAYFHGNCVGFNHPDGVPEVWRCDACSYRAILSEVANEISASGRSDQSHNIIDSTFIINRIVEACLAKRTLQVPYKYHMAKWVQELTKQSKCKPVEGRTEVGYQQAITQILERWRSPGNATSRAIAKICFTEEGGARALLLLTTNSSNFSKSFNAIMGLMLKLMSDKRHASLRKLSIKAIEKVVDADPKLMLLSKVMNAVSLRLSDEAISVREAVISLVGSYVVSSPALANAFHTHLIPRLLDPGVSVRKRTVKILQDILCSNPHYKGRSDACNKCLQRAADPKEDDGVREALHSLFMTLWLEDGDIRVASTIAAASPVRFRLALSPSTPGSAGGNSVASGVVTPTPPIDGRATRSNKKQLGKLRSELAAEQMVEAVKIGGTNENLANFLRELLCNVNDSDKGKKAGERIKRQKIAEKQCFNLVDSLFELLLAMEEARAVRADVTGADVVATIRTIGVFAEVSTGAVLKHLETILPYLKADNGLPPAEESALASAAADILFRVTPLLDSAEMDKLSSGSVGKDLVAITYKFGSGALFSAVRALCCLAHHRDAGENNAFGKKLMGLATTFYAYLIKKEGSPDFLDISAKNNVQRLLSGLGSLCRHHEVAVDASDWNDEVDYDDIELYETAELTWDNVPLACFRLFSKYLDKSDAEIKCSALRALTGIFAQHPRLMLASAQSGLIENVMAQDAPLELQMESLRCWRDISLAEEKRIDSGEAKRKIDSKAGITTSKKVSGDQDGDSTLVGGVLTKQTARLFEMTQSKEAGLRIASLELLGQLLRQGLVNPNEAVPFLLALQGDVENIGVRKFALNLLILEGEKRPDMLRQRVCAGVKQACSFQREAYPTKETSALVKTHKGHRVEVECVFDNVFRACIVGIKKQREGLYRNLIAMFEHVETDKINGQSSITASAKKARRRRSSVEVPPSANADISLLSFAAQVLAYLPYTSVGDPLFIQHHATSIVALQAPQLLDRLAAFLRPYGLASSDELDDANFEEDSLERAAKSNAPSRSKEAEPLSKEDFDWPGFVNLVREASAMALLLRLKNFLRKKYNISEARCLEYNPDAKERNFGRGAISRNDDIVLFDASVANVSPDNLIHGDEDRVLRHYALFRSLVRAETSTDVNDMGLDSGEADGDDMEGEADADGEGGNVAVAASASKPKKRRRSSASGGPRNKKGRSSATPLLGVRVSKEFSEGQYFQGTVVSGPHEAEQENGSMAHVWKVKYDDGDEEELSASEIELWKLSDAGPPTGP